LGGGSGGFWPLLTGPAQAAGLELEFGGNKWLRLIQNAKSEKGRVI
jgi:hypothetical protein